MRREYIISPLADGVLFIFSPLLAVALGTFGGPLLAATITGVTLAHQVLVLFRTHGNPRIFRLYPVRFLIVPPLLFAAAVRWHAVIGVLLLLTAWWDIYHFSMQTFGLGRIYDAMQGSDPHVGRRLDQMLNLVLYVGPLAAGNVLIDQLGTLRRLSNLGLALFAKVPGAVSPHVMAIRVVVLAVSLPLLVYYVVAYRRLERQGYRVSRQKVAMLASTAFCSIFAWGFNPFGNAYFIINFFHAVQYFGIVWRFEGPRPSIVAVGVGYGLAGQFAGGMIPGMYALTLVIAVLHCWYDGFVWSVRKAQV